MTTPSGPIGPRSGGPDDGDQQRRDNNPRGRYGHLGGVPDGSGDGVDHPTSTGGDYPPSAAPGGPPTRYDSPAAYGDYAPAPRFGAYVAPGQAMPDHPVPGPPHPDNDPHKLRRRVERRSPVGVRVRSSRPVVTYSVMGLIAAVYVLQQITGIQSELLYWPAVTEFEPWRMLTTVVLHGGLAHLAFNVYALWIAGQMLEPAIGRWRLVVLMLLTALGGSTAVLLLSGGPGAVGWVTGVVGFSGAVMGLFGAIFAVLRSAGQQAGQLLVLLGINIAIGFIPGWNISWQAHLGGMVVGIALGLVWSTWRTKRADLVAVGSSILVGLALVAACAVYLAAA